MESVERFLKRCLISVDFVQEISDFVREVLEDIEAQATWFIPHGSERGVLYRCEKIIPFVRLDPDLCEYSEHFYPPIYALALN